MLEPFLNLPPAWLREAEVSWSSHAPQRLGFQTRFDSADDLSHFLEGAGFDPSPFVEADAEVRSRFLVNPARWAKVGCVGGRPVEASQYFLLDPSCHYPITTLRVFARRLGQGAHPQLESLLMPALEERDARWGIALKPSPSGRRAAAFCNIPRTTLDRLGTEAVALEALTRPLGGLPRVFLTFDLADPSQVALDIEDPSDISPLHGWLSKLSERPPRYLKCRRSGGEVRWTAYFPWTSVAPSPPPARRLDDIRGYYERSHQDYLECVGSTLQAALLGETPTASNLALAERAGLQAGMHVLDAGCGVCGPALDIARALEVSIDGVTLSPAQVATAQARIDESGLGGRVRVMLGDFHALEAADATYDAVVMFESASYSTDPPRLFAELWRVLRPGGRLYIKDFCLSEHPFDASERRAVDDYDFTYCTQTRTLSYTIEALRKSGFTEIRCEPLTEASMAHFHQAMIEAEPRGTVGSAFMTAVAPVPRLSRFGRYHRRSWETLPVEAFQLSARRT